MSWVAGTLCVFQMASVTPKIEHGERSYPGNNKVLRILLTEDPPMRRVQDRIDHPQQVA